jgi:hypothetical protein
MKRFLWIIPLGAMVALVAQTPMLIRQGGNTAAVTAGSALKVDGSAATQPISAAALPLPTGAATSSLQTTGNTSLANIETYTSRIPSLGQALAAASVPVVLTSAQLSTLTPLSTVAVTQSTSPWVVSNGGTFAVQSTLQAGSALVGKVGLDQTTPGTTNAVSLAQIGSTATATGNGVVGAGVQRVAIASDNTAFSVNATLSAETTKVIGTVNVASGQTIGLAAGTNAIGKLAANTGVTIGAVEIAASQSVAVTQATSSNLKGQMDPLTAASWGLGATGAAPPATGNFQTGIGSGATGGLAIGPTICDQWVAINGTASAQLIAGVSGRKIYFCSGNIQMNGGANTVSFVSGTGSTCGTGTTAVPGFDGATTAANGYSFAANSGMTWDGAGGAAFARTTNNADNFCILVGSATRVVGGLNYAIY